MNPLYVHETGSPGSPAVVFLQGSAASGRMWRGHMERLTGYHCLAPDLPGFGRSNRVPWHTAAETAGLVADLIETRVPAGKAHVVGLSWGGGITHHLLARRPDLLDRVLVDGAGLIPAPWEAWPILAGMVLISPFLHTRPVIELINRSVGGGFTDEDREDVRRASKHAFRRSFIEGLSGEIPREQVEAEIRAPCPTLLVAGEHERAIRQSNAALAASMPNAIARYVPGTRHGWVGVRAELHRAMVEAWLADAPLPGGLLPEDLDPGPAIEQLLGRRPAIAPTERHAPVG